MDEERTYIFHLLCLITFLYEILDFTFLDVPWTPVALIGTAVAFMVGFQNNAAYDRIWEARKIWGGIVNTSRTWGMKVQEMINNQYASSPVELEDLKKEKKKLIYRHIAWMTALRYAMRQRKPWETSHLSRSNRKWADLLHIPEKISSLEDNLMLYLSAEEEEYVLSKSNKQTAILYLQSKHIGQLKEKGIIWEFSFLELENVLGELFIHQGKSERIKNFPYPRQYASLAYYLVKLFVVLLPFGIVSEFADIAKYISINHPSVGSYFIWLSVPFCACVSWAFHIMERMARIGENPFEGGPNDVPISNISRGITRDILQIIEEDSDKIPEPFENMNHVHM